MYLFFNTYAFNDVMKFEHLKFESDFLENEKNFWSEIKNIFPNFISTLF